jgi:hypothetical protein
VRHTAARHGGAFALHLGEQGASAVLELPLAERRGKAPRRDLASATRPLLRRDESGPRPTAGQGGVS